MNITSVWGPRLAALLSTVALSSCASDAPLQAPQVNAPPGPQALQHLPRKPGELVTVSICEF